MNNNSEEQTPLINSDDDNDSDNAGMIYFQCQGEYSGTKKCTFCPIREQCIRDSKKWW